MATYTLNVNGKTETVDADPAMPLLWVLRDKLDLKGTKFGCGVASCGACTVHIDGDVARACITPISAAWVELQVPQCGYCQSGQVMSATALLETNASPSDADIDAAMSGNICRCGTYSRIRAGIHMAAASLKSNGGAA